LEGVVVSRRSLAGLTTASAATAVTSDRVMRMAAAFDEGTGGDYRPIFSITFYRLYPDYGDITAMENRPRR
jgi:hypothetical protein